MLLVMLLQKTALPPALPDGTGCDLLAQRAGGGREKGRNLQTEVAAFAIPASK
jgi:hypothetical protein